MHWPRHFPDSGPDQQVTYSSLLVRRRVIKWLSEWSFALTRFWINTLSFVQLLDAQYKFSFLFPRNCLHNCSDIYVYSRGGYCLVGGRGDGAGCCPGNRGRRCCTCCQRHPGHGDQVYGQDAYDVEYGDVIFVPVRTVISVQETLTKTTFDVTAVDEKSVWWMSLCPRCVGRVYSLGRDI